MPPPVVLGLIDAAKRIREIDKSVGVRASQIEAGLLRFERDNLLSELGRLHDECCDDGPRRQLDRGPMIAPSEAAVLDARKLLGRGSGRS